MPRITRANNILSDKNGFTQGEIVAIQDAENSQYGDQYEWCFAVDTRKGTKTIIRLWTYKTVNKEKNYYPTENSPPEYNLLTQVCLRLKVIDEATLISTKEIDIELSEELEGKLVRFKTKPSKKRRALREIDISTLELVS